MKKLEQNSALASLHVVIKFISSYIDDQDWYLKYINQTTSNFPPKIQSFIIETETQDYSAYYTDVNNLKILFFKGITPIPEALELIKSLKRIPVDKASLIVDPFLDWLAKFELDDLDDGQDTEVEDVNDEEAEAIRNLIRYGLISLKDLTALLVFGERIFSLVNKALSGDIESFSKVIQIDPSAAKNIPEFKLIIGDAYASEKSDLLDSINYRKNNFVGRSRFNYHHIFMLFYVLDMLQLLDRMTNRQVLDLYIESGLNSYEEILEIKTVADRRKFYLRSKI